MLALYLYLINWDHIPFLSKNSEHFNYSDIAGHFERHYERYHYI